MLLLDWHHPESMFNPVPGTFLGTCLPETPVIMTAIPEKDCFISFFGVCHTLKLIFFGFHKWM